MTEMEPMDLQQWFNVWLSTTDETLYYKKAAERQIMDVRDSIARGLLRANAMVISTHRSKSVVLPVYRIDRPDIGLSVVLRENFYNWKLSVLSERPIEANFDGLFYTTPPVEPEYTGNYLHPVYFEGFPADLIFGYYEPSDKRRWSAELWGGDYALWTTLYLIRKALDDMKPMKWHTQESHRAELAAQRVQWEAERKAEKAKEAQG